MNKFSVHPRLSCSPQGFYCHPPFIVTYVLVILVMMVCSGGLAVIRKFRATEYDYLRNGVYVGTVVFAVVPIVHWVVLCADGPSGKCELTFLTSCLLMYALLVCV